MVDMLHARGNHLFYDRKQAQRMKPYPPLRSLLAAALPRQNGVSVAAGDVDQEPPEQKSGPALDSCPPCWVLICELIGQSVGLTSNYLATGQPRFNVSRAHRTDLEFRIQSRHSRRLCQHTDEPLRSGTAEAPDPHRIHAARLALLETREEVGA